MTGIYRFISRMITKAGRTTSIAVALNGRHRRRRRRRFSRRRDAAVVWSTSTRPDSLPGFTLAVRPEFWNVPPSPFRSVGLFSGTDWIRLCSAKHSGTPWLFLDIFHFLREY